MSPEESLLSFAREPILGVPSTGTGKKGGRPLVMGTRGVVASGHYLATQAGLDILKRGGNAMDAAAAAGIALNVVQPHQNGFGGEAPLLVFSARERKVWALSGHGTAPRKASLRAFKDLGLKKIPFDGQLGATVPPILSTWITLLEKYGTLRLVDVLEPSVYLAKQGFPMYDMLHTVIRHLEKRFKKEWPSSAEKFLPGGQAPAVGEVWRQPVLARTFERLIQAEAKHRDRRSGLRAAHDHFYQGDMAKAMADFSTKNSFRDTSGQSHRGFLCAEDMANFRAEFEEAPSAMFHGLEIFKCGFWTQGPVLLQVLNLLQGYDLKAMGPNSAESIHVLVECLKLALADREFYYGDPKFSDVPMEKLLSMEYARERRALVDESKASTELRPGWHPAIQAKSVLDVEASYFQAPEAGIRGDTTKLEVIDAEGNMVSATISGAWLMHSPVIPELGFSLGTRCQMFSLTEGHPNCIEPGKRPRTTLTPGLALRDSEPYMSFGSPGGDGQDQWALQFLVNHLVHKMNIQEAVEAPTFESFHAPSSFYPRRAMPGLLRVERRIDEAVRQKLGDMGHTVMAAGAWSGGNTLAACIDTKTGVLSGAASPRLVPAYAEAY